MYNGTAPPSSPGEGTSFHCEPTGFAPSDLTLEPLDSSTLLTGTEGTAIITLRERDDDEQDASINAMSHG